MHNDGSEAQHQHRPIAFIARPSRVASSAPNRRSQRRDPQAGSIGIIFQTLSLSFSGWGLTALSAKASQLVQRASTCEKRLVACFSLKGLRLAIRSFNRRRAATGLIIWGQWAFCLTTLVVEPLLTDSPTLRIVRCPRTPRKTF